MNKPARSPGLDARMTIGSAQLSSLRKCHRTGGGQRTAAGR